MVVEVVVVVAATVPTAILLPRASGFADFAGGVVAR